MKPQKPESTQSKAPDTPHKRSWFSLRGAVLVLIPIVAAQSLLIGHLMQDRDEYAHKINQLSRQLVKRASVHRADIQHEKGPLAAIPSNELLKILTLPLLDELVHEAAVDTPILQEFIVKLVIAL